MTGQTKIQEAIKMGLKASKIRHRPFPHTLFSGQAGMGKTSFALMITQSLGTKFIPVLGSAIKDVEDAGRLLAMLEPMAVLFIDEIHALPSKAEELFYIAMEQGQMFVDGNIIELPEFTLLAATTKEGQLSQPLRSRFQNIFRLSEYSVQEMGEIVRNRAKNDKLGVSDDAVDAIVSVSRGIPREAVNVLKNAIDMTIVLGNKKVTKGVVEKSIFFSDLDKSGLSTTDLSVLKVMRKFRKSVGLQTLAITAGLQVQTLRDVIEPYLIKKGFMTIGRGGRSLTYQGLRYLERTK